MTCVSPRSHAHARAPRVYVQKWVSRRYVREFQSRVTLRVYARYHEACETLLTLRHPRIRLSTVRPRIVHVTNSCDSHCAVLTLARQHKIDFRIFTRHPFFFFLSVLSFTLLSAKYSSQNCPK